MTDSDAQTEAAMTVPPDYARASDRFEAFLVHARDALGHQTTHQAYATVLAVFRVFRRRLDVRDALTFADMLPPLLRAMFVADWDIDLPRPRFGDRAALTREVQEFRRDHNFAPDNAIAEVATVLRRHVDGPAFERTIARLPPEAAAYWWS